MKIILFDILKNSKKKIEIKKCINIFEECIYVYLNESIIDDSSIIKKIINIVFEKYIYMIFKSKKFNRIKNIYILSYNFEKNKKLKDKLYKILDDRFIEITSNDTIKKNSIKYLEKYTYNQKVLCIISKQLDKSILIKYIEKFKIVDLLYIGKKSNDFLKKVNNINIEYGSTISFAKNKDLTFYDIYVVFNNVDLKSYILNKKSKFFDFTCSDNDIYSYEYKIYNKYSNEIVNKDKYSKTKLGKLIYIYLTNGV